MSTTENTLPRKRWSCCLIVAICAAIPLLMIGGVLLIMLIPAPPLVISEKTTRITGPLTADGQIDFFKALEQQQYPPELATDDNGFRLFVRQFGDVSTHDSQEFYRLQKYKQLGLDPNTPPTLTLPPEPVEVLENYYKTTEEEPPWTQFKAHNWTQSNIEERLWTLETYPILTDWINEIDVPMDALAEMIRKPVFLPPLYSNPEDNEYLEKNLWSLLLLDCQNFRSIARIFRARAAYRIGQGNTDDAIDDKLTIHRFGRLTAQKCGIIQVFVGIAIEGMAAAIPVNANPEHPLTAQQIRCILEGLDALPPRTSPHDTFEWERIVMLSVVQDIANGHREPFLESQELYRVLSSPDVNVLLYFVSFDWNVVYRRINEMFDAMHELPLKTKFEPMVQQAVTNVRSGIGGRIWTPGNRAAFLADLFAAFMPAIMAFEGAMQRIECADNMQRLALAILLYQLENGKMPDENWAVQIEQYLGENAEQYFSCPSNPSPKGETTCALVQYGDAVPGSRDAILLVELVESVPLDKAVVTVDEVLERKRTGSLHIGGMNVAYRSGAVRFLSESVSEKELLRLLDRKVGAVTDLPSP